MVITVIAVAKRQFHRVKTIILDIRRKYITPHPEQEDEQVHTIANGKSQAKLNTCIRHLQGIME